MTEKARASAPVGIARCCLPYADKAPRRRSFAVIMGSNGDCFAVTRIFVPICRHPLAGEASAEFSITSLLVNRSPEKSVRSGAIITLICGGEKTLGRCPKPCLKTSCKKFSRLSRTFNKGIFIPLCAVPVVRNGSPCRLLWVNPVSLPPLLLFCIYAGREHTREQPTTGRRWNAPRSLCRG